MSQTDENYQKALRKIIDAKVNNNTHLSLGHMRLIRVPPEIGDLTQLKSLDLSNNQLKTLPSEIASLKNLQELYLNTNLFTILPTEICFLENLRNFQLYYNNLTFLPEKIGQLKNLNEISIYGNDLSDLPLTFSRLKHLKSLRLDSNKFSKFPAEIFQLSHLETIVFGGNRITSIPSEISNLPSLKKLYLWKTKISTIPFDILRNKSLQVLSLTETSLRGFPKGVLTLVSLRELHLSGIHISKIPPEISQLKNLKSLFLENNHLEDIPDELGEISGLEILSLSNNQLRVFPKKLSKLTQLKSLFLSNNLLMSLPNEIGKLSNLKKLDLIGNQLMDLPHGINRLSNLETLLLHDNNLRIPSEIFGSHKIYENKYAQTILGFLTDLREGQALNETKMLVVGQGGVGKTSLIQQLVENKFDANSLKTEGIDIRDLKIVLKDNCEVKLNIWDFGGQEVMHSTHQFFLTQRSIYLYVLNARDEQRANRLDYWLNLIEQYGGTDAPIILVINKIDDNPILNLNESSLKRKYNIIGIYRTSCQTGEGVEELRATIHETIEGLPHVSDNIPPTWAKVKDALEIERTQKDIIEYISFSKLCDEHEINETIRPAALRLFHDLGTVLNFYQEGADDSLEDTKILNPKWVTDGVYAIINSKIVFENKGVLEKRQLKNILDSDRYKRYNERAFILGMMEQFELAYPFNDGKSYLVPDLLPESEPSDLGSEESLNFEYHYTNFVPPSLISRFIVRKHENIINRETELWKNGVVIHFDGMRALVRSEEIAKKLTISVKGPSHRCRELLAIVRDEFDSIHSSFVTLKFKPMVPIPGEDGASVSYRALLAAERDGKSEVYVEDLDEHIAVRPLLEGVDGSISNQKLFYALQDRFSEEEIRTALFKIGIDHENILSQYKGKTAYARETVLHLERSGKIDAFVGEIRKSRPDIDL